MTDGFIWDDRTWDRVWERVLNPVERHDIAMAVLRRRLPVTAFERRIAVELARRWRRHALALALLYLLWTVFWGAVGWDTLRLYGGEPARVPLGCAVVGMAAIVACVAFRARLKPLLVA